MITHAAPQKHYTVLLSRPVSVVLFAISIARLSENAMPAALRRAYARKSYTQSSSSAKLVRL